MDGKKYWRIKEIKMLENIIMAQERASMKRIEKSIISIVLVLLVLFSSCITLHQSVEAAEKQPRKIIFNCTSKKMSVGQKYRLKVDKTKPSNASKEVIWTSSNEEIATVNVKGLVCAKATGTVIITAQVEGADDIVAKCKIKIYKAAKKIILNHKSKTVYVGETVKCFLQALFAQSCKKFL